MPDHNLGWRLAMLLGNGGNHLVLQNVGEGRLGRGRGPPRRSQGPVTHHLDVELVHGLPELLLLEEGIALNLVDSNWDLGCLGNPLKLVAVEVGDTNGPALAREDKLLHFSPEGNMISVLVKYSLL